MPRTPDRRAGPLLEERIILEDYGDDPGGPGELVYKSGAFVMQDAAGTFDPRTGSGGISAEQHRVLRQLIHFLDDGPGEGFASNAYRETLPAGSPFPTTITWWESAAKSKRIVERSITWSGVVPSVDAWDVYDTEGTTKLATVSDSITYSGVFETSRTRTITIH